MGCHAKFFMGLALTASKRYFLLITEFKIAPLGNDSVKYSFYFGGIAFIVTVLWTVITKEYSRRISRF
jgi:maltose/moltooligosaccharide transporter